MGNPRYADIVAGYTRVSTLHQGAENHPDQEKRIKDYAKTQGYSIFKICQDKECGAEENRIRFQELIRGALRHKFEKIVFTHWDRFPRDARDTRNYHHKLEKVGVALVCLSLGIDTGAPERETGAVNLEDQIRTASRS
jgi:DNA invertase Pin-like site-specific DNA recombinase